MKNSIVTMKRVLITILLIAVSQVMMAQGRSITGTIVDSNTKETISGAIITIGDHKVYSDIDGRFLLPADEGKSLLTVSYIGYKSMTIDVSKEHNLGIVEIKMDAKVLPDAIITSQLAVPRKTPVSVSNVLASLVSTKNRDELKF